VSGAPARGTGLRIRQRLRPAIGWWAVLLVLGLLLVTGVSVADARVIVLGGVARDALPIVAIAAAGLAGVILGASRLGVVRAHLVGAAAGALVLLLSAAAANDPQATSSGTGLSFDALLWGERLSALNATLQTELRRFLDAGDVPPATLTYLVLGALCWTTGQFSAFGVLRYRRAGPAIGASGALLFLNEALPAAPGAADRVPVLVSLSLFALLAMMLLVRLQLGAQGSQWLRRQVADSPEVRRLYLRAGGAFVVLVVVVPRHSRHSPGSPRRPWTAARCVNPWNGCAQRPRVG
jgi:hypothetical protein